MYNSLHSDFSGKYQAGNYEEATKPLLVELSRILVEKRGDFVFLLNESGLNASVDMPDSELINLFVENLGQNDNLALGASLLINMNNKKAGFDGDEVMDDGSVRAMYYTLHNNFSNAGGGGIVGAIAGAVGEGSKALTQGLANKGKRTLDVNAPLAALQKKQEAKAAMQMQAAQLKQTQAEASAKKKDASAKTKKIIIIASISLVVIAGIIGTIIYFKRK